MKLRKHKNTKPFNIHFRVRSSVVIANRGNVGGWEQREQQLGRVQIVNAQANSIGEVVRGFLFGRDRNNTIITRVHCVA